MLLVPQIQCIFSKLVLLNIRKKKHIHKEHVIISDVYIYMYVFDKSILKSFNNVYQKKIILKAHLFVQNILGSLQKLFQCNNNLSKHQRKINTAINTNLPN